MSKKIKEIDINAFRAYKDMQKFNFVHSVSGKTANLVAIYAPNGYGKTSFFDAIEWAITDEIGRLKSEKPVIEEVKKEQDYILKNRDSDAECGSVKIIAEDGAVLEVKTKKKKGNMKGDYKPGDIEIISKQLQSILSEKETFCTTNLLAHDKITGFLQRYTDKEKTNQLSVMWDENNYTEIVRDITELYYEVEKKRKSLSLEIAKKEKELAKYKYENNQHDKIEKAISDYEEKYGVTIVGNSDLISEIDVLLLKFKELNDRTNKAIAEIEAEEVANEMLANDYIPFEEHKRNIEAKVQQKKELECLIVICEELERLKGREAKLKKELGELAFLLSAIEEFYGDVEKISLNDIEVKFIEKEKADIQKKKVDITAEVQELEIRIKKDKTEGEFLQEKIEELQDDFDRYENNHQVELKYIKLCAKANDILEKRQDRVSKLSSDIDRLKIFGDTVSGIESLQDISTKNLVDVYLVLEKLKEEKKLLIENIDILESNKKNIVYLLDKMEQLTVLGKDIISETNTAKCPLCHAEYNNSELLFERVCKTYNDNEEVQKINNQLNRNIERKQIVEKNLVEQEEKINTIICDILDKYEEKYLRENEKIGRLKMRISDWDGMVSHSEKVKRNLLEKYTSEDVLNIANRKDVEGRLNRLKSEKKNIIENIDRYYKLIEKQNEGLAEIIKKMQELDLKEISINEQNNDIRNTKLYSTVKGLLESRELTIQEYTCNDMKQMIESEHKKLADQKRILEIKAEDYQGIVSEDKDNYEANLKALQREINELQVNVDSFLARCVKTVGICKPNESIMTKIEERGIELKEKRNVFEEKEHSEQKILLNVNSLKEQKMWLEQVQENNEKKMRLDFLTKRLEKLSESKSVAEEFVVERTNEYFNSDIINQIYSRIDPHPTMKHIKFHTQKDANGLKTHIYTYDEAEENKMSPVLYLSSAQVNILSLCIFLAKVLNEKNTTFNTIFMDDPIQHLDGINLLAFIDVLRTITTEMGRQIIISTHNEQFYKLLKLKLDDRFYPSKFIELSSAGVLK